jgi:serine/threonine protein kinase
MSEETARHHNATPSALPAGTRLGEFELLSLLGVGGFGIVYLAFDHALEREVAVKEYMPASLAGRTETMFVSIRSQSDAETFALGLKSFVNEARLLARFDHPSLLKVHRFWEGNGTAYMAMPVLRGHTVKEVRLAMSQPPDEAWARSVLDPLLGAIEKLHSEGVYHRDIAPDNIQIEPDGHPVLLDFGAARRVLSDKSQALTAILKPAYAPIEQYAEAGSVKQGPWTDIYALGATLHFLLLARPPSPATARAVHDDASALTTMALPGCSENFLRIIDWMLAPRPADRPQSVAALREVLEGRAATPLRRVAAQQPASDWDRTVILPSSQANSTTLVVSSTQQQPAALDQRTTQAMSPAGTAPARPTGAHAHSDEQTVRVSRPVQQADMTAAPVNLASATVAGGGSRRLMIGVGVGVGALVLVAVAAMVLKGKPESSPAVAEMAAASAPSAASAALAAAPVASVAESAVTTVVVAPAAALAASPGAAAAVVAAAPAVEPGKPIAAPTPKVPPAKGSASKTVRGAAPVAVAPATPAAPALVAATTPEPAKPKVEVALVPAPAPSPVVEAPKPVASNPEAVCGGRNPLLYFVCMEKECLRTEQMGHADCKKWRRSAVRQE